MKPITILDVAQARGAKPEPDGTLTGAEFERVGLAILGGCQVCGASVAAYNAYPSCTGFWRCEDCVGDTGFDTVEEFEDHAAPKHLRASLGLLRRVVRDIHKHVEFQAAKCDVLEAMRLLHQIPFRDDTESTD